MYTTYVKTIEMPYNKENAITCACEQLYSYIRFHNHVSYQEDVHMNVRTREPCHIIIIRDMVGTKSGAMYG